MVVLIILHGFSSRGLICYGRIWHQILSRVDLIHMRFRIVLLVHVLKIAFVVVSLVRILVFRTLIANIVKVLLWIILIQIALVALRFLHLVDLAIAVLLVTFVSLETFLFVACVQNEQVVARIDLIAVASKQLYLLTEHPRAKVNLEAWVITFLASLAQIRFCQI